VGKGGLGSIFDAQNYFERLEDQMQDSKMARLVESGEFQRGEAEKNLAASLQMKSGVLSAIRRDPDLGKFLDFGGGGGGFGLDESVGRAVQDRLARQGIAQSPIGAQIGGARLGVAGHQIREQDRSRRMQLATGVIGGGIPMAPQLQTPGLFAQASLNQPMNFGSQFAMAGQMGMQQSTLDLERNAANAQFLQQWKQDLGKGFMMAAMGGQGG